MLQNQCRIEVGAIDAVALVPFEKQAHGHGRENEKSLLYFGRDFSGRYNFGKTLKIVATGCHSLRLKCTKFHFSAPSDPLAGFTGACFYRELLDTVKARKLVYYGHTMRKQGSCLEKEIMQGTMPGARRR